mgnify:FL=1
MLFRSLDDWLGKHPLARLVVLDPISGFLGDDIDSHKNAEVRSVLAMLAAVATKHRVAVVGITHLSKAQAKAINRVIGSIAFVAAARAVWLVDWDPNEDGRRLLLPVKNNLAASDGLAYTITDARIVWEAGRITITADELGDPSHSTPREEAEGWLRDFLAAGPVPSAKVANEADRAGIAKRTLHRAKRDLGIVSCREGAAWAWALPDSREADCAT